MKHITRILFVLLASTLFLQPQLAWATDADDIRQIVKGYYKACADEDIEAVAAIWASAAPRQFAEALVDHALLFQATESTLHELRIDRIEVQPGGELARADVHLDATIAITVDKDGQTESRRSSTDRAVVLVKSEEGWHIARVVSQTTLQLAETAAEFETRRELVQSDKDTAGPAEVPGPQNIASDPNPEQNNGTKPEPVAKLNVLRHAKLGYALRIPAEWKQLVPDDNKGTLGVWGPTPDDLPMLTLMYRKTPRQLTAKEIAAVGGDGADEELFAKLVSQQIIKRPDGQMFTAAYDGKSDGVALRSTQLIVSTPKSLYIIVGMCRASDKPGIAQMKSAIDSFRADGQLDK